MRRQLCFRFGVIEDFTPGPGHVDAAPQLVKAFGDAGNGLRMTFRSLFKLKVPGIEKRVRCIKQVRPDDLRGSNCTDSPEVAANRVEIVVRNEVPEAPSRAICRSDDNWRIQGLEPEQRSFGLVGGYRPHAAPARSA